MKKIYLYQLFILLSILFSNTINAQINITYPSSRAVFQRNNNNETAVYLAGNYLSFADKIEARAIPRTMSSPQGIAVNWTTIQTNPVNGFFHGTLTITGGWYDIEVRYWNNTTLLGSTSIQRIGIGEVFLIAGQSNATGDGDLRNAGNYGPMASDDRITIVNFANTPTNSFGATTLPRSEFSHLDSTYNIAPFGVSAWCWGAVGDSLIKKLNVPIAFFNAGWSGTGLTAWYQSAIDSTATPFNFFIMPRGMPYGNLRAALHFYINQYGIRAVLWHQGETDNLAETSRIVYGQYLKSIINLSRTHSGKSNLTWVVSRASRYKGFQLTSSRTWQPVIDAQNDVIGLNGNNQENYTSHVVEGPATDAYVGPGIRTNDSLHFAGQGHRILAQLWSQKLNASFFTNTQPYEATPPPTILSACNGSTNLMLSLPTAYPSIQWSTDESALNVVSNNPTYLASSNQSFRARIKDISGNIFISPKITVPNTFTGLIPISSGVSGTWHDNATWNCGRIPSSNDVVIINAGHQIIVGSGLTARYRKLELKGNLRFLSASKLQN